jgi:hypothetical protein
VPGLAVHDFDEIGVPRWADTAWRHRADERWLRRALGYQADGVDLLLAGQTPFGELLATPSAAELQAISACLIDCDDQARVTRLEQRGPDWFGRNNGTLRDYVAWADWMRRHASDPSWRIDVIRHEATENEMCWSRWDGWQAGDPRWRMHVIDTSAVPVPEVAVDPLNQLDGERALVGSGAHPLAGSRT